MAVKGLRVELNSAGIKALLSSPEVQADLLRRAEAIAAAAGGAPNFEASVRVVGGSSKAGRAYGTVRTATFEGQAAEATDRALTRAIDAGRG